DIQRLKEKWDNAKARGIRGAIHAVAVLLVRRLFGLLPAAGIAAANALINEVVVNLFIKALIALKNMKKRKVIKEFDPKMVKACETAKKQKVRDITKTLEEVSDKQSSVEKDLSLRSIFATFDMLNTLIDTLDNEKIAGTVHATGIETRIAGMSSMAITQAIKKLPGVCKFVDAEAIEIKEEIKRVSKDLDRIRKELVLNPDTISYSIGALAGGVLASIFFGAPVAMAVGLGVAAYWAIIGLGALYVTVLKVLYKLKIRKALNKNKIIKICQQYGKGVSEQKIRKLLEEYLEDNPEVMDQSQPNAPALNASAGYPNVLAMVESDLEEMTVELDQLYILAEKIADTHNKDASIKDRLVKQTAKLWSKLIVKAPGLCRYTGMTEYGLKKVIARVEKEFAVVKKHWNGRRGDAAKGAAIAIVARVKGFPPGSEIIAQFSLPLIEKLVGLYLKGLYLLQKFFAQRVPPAILYEALVSACEDAYKSKAPDEKVILKEEQSYQKKFENGELFSALPPHVSN
ncbi:MAG: hypothetical protein DRJ03_27655, partial [Chloroflexi bacterium]